MIRILMLLTAISNGEAEAKPNRLSLHSKLWLEKIDQIDLSRLRKDQRDSISDIRKDLMSLLEAKFPEVSFQGLSTFTQPCEPKFEMMSELVADATTRARGVCISSGFDEADCLAKKPEWYLTGQTSEYQDTLSGKLAPLCKIRVTVVVPATDFEVVSANHK